MKVEWIEWVDLAFALVGIAAFRWLKAETAALAVLLGGWILLPVGAYPSDSTGSAFPYWIIGLALPSDVTFAKAWVAPVVALAGSALCATARWRELRPVWLDLPVALWCAWPLLAARFAPSADPSGPAAALYLTATWGATWLLGRLHFGRREARLRLVAGLALAALACLPIALIEGAAGPVLYGWLYGPHPFRFDGADRYLGYRPIGFFEHGNQYGLWTSLCALAAVWCVVAARRSGGRIDSHRAALAAVAVTIAVAAQSVGALLLAAGGALLLGAFRWVRPRSIVIGLVGLLVLAGAVYLSGIVPFERIGRHTAFGQEVMAAFRSIGRGSFTWRISQDQKLLGDALHHPVFGAAAWDWWRPRGTRPWGLPTLLLGQFGLGGLVLAFGSPLAPLLRAAWLAPRRSGWRVEALPMLLATLVGLALADALLNSFIFFPALLVAGALASAPAADLRFEDRP